MERPSDAATELGNLQRMGQPGAEQVALMVEKNLGLVDQAAKSGGMDDAVTVPLKCRARWCVGLGKPATARGTRV